MTFMTIVFGCVSAMLLGIAFGAREAELAFVATGLAAVLVATRNR